MPASIPPTHIGDNEILDLKAKCYPIIDAKETNPDFKFLTWGHLGAILGQSLQRYFDKDPATRIAWGQYEAGQKLVEW